MGYRNSTGIVLGSLAIWACSSTTTTGWGGITIQTPTSLTHGACGAFVLQHTQPTPGEDLVGPAPNAENLTVSGTNGVIYIDATCNTEATGGAITFPAGVESVPFGFKPTQAGSCVLTVDGPANSSISSNVTVTAS